MHVPLQASEFDNSQLFLSLSPILPVSDVGLMQVLLEIIAATACDVQFYYGLMSTILSCWQDDTEQHVLVLHHSMHKPIQCTYLLAHHCMDLFKSWMLHHKHIRQNLSASSCCTTSHHYITTEQRVLTSLGFTKKTLGMRIAGPTCPSGGCVPTPLWSRTLKACINV